MIGQSPGSTLFSGQRVIVTGGAGFIGSHLIGRLLGEGAHVTCIDNMLTGRGENLRPFLGHPSFVFIRHDVVSPYEGTPHFIYNLACAASPKQYQQRPTHTFKTSILGALNALELARKTGARVLQASTSEVYGCPEVHPQTESYWGHVNPVGVRSCYDEGKRGAETLFADYHREHEVDTRIVRIFNTYGPRMRVDDGRVVSNFIVQALKGEPITIYGDGRQTRSFCFVDDLVDGLVAAMAHPSIGPSPINLGNPEEFTIEALARLILSVTGSSARIEFRPLPQDDPVQRKPDISHARAALGWFPEVGLVAGLKRTIEYFCIETSASSACLDESL